MVDLKTAKAALESDAGIWDAAGNSVAAPAGAIGGLGLTGHDVSMYGVDAGIDKTYQGAQAALTSMLQQAQQNFHDLAGALRHAASLYEQAEADHQQKIQRAGGGN